MFGLFKDYESFAKEVFASPDKPEDTASYYDTEAYAESCIDELGASSQIQITKWMTDSINLSSKEAEPVLSSKDKRQISRWMLASGRLPVNYEPAPLIMDKIESWWNSDAVWEKHYEAVSRPEYRQESFFLDEFLEWYNSLFMDSSE